MQEDRERIYANYAKLHPPTEEVDAEDVETQRKKVAASAKESFADRSKAARSRIFGAKPEPKPEPDVDDGRPVAHRALDSFIEAHPEYANESAFNEVANTALNSMHDDIFRLRNRFNETGNRADGEALFTRAAEITPGEKKLAADRAAVAAMQRRHLETKGPV